MIESAQSDIQKIALDLLSEGKVDLFIGYEKASIPLKSRPYFIYPDGTASGETENAGSLDGGPSDADKKAALEKMTSNLVWDSFCANNIAAFLQKHFENVPNRRKPRENGYPTIGVVVKGCDLRSVVALIKERQVVRENLVLVGVPCQGMIDKRKVEAKLGGMEVKEYHETSDDVLHVTTLDGKKHSFPKADVMQDACIECRFPMPENTDFMIAGEAKEPGDGGYARIAEFEAKPRKRGGHIFRKSFPNVYAVMRAVRHAHMLVQGVFCRPYRSEMDRRR